jgi:4-hydroxy-3-methylbut-2-enyl diphosphate reductase
VQRASEIDWATFGSISSLAVTAGASAPEDLVQEVVGAFAERFSVSVDTIMTAQEDMFFPLPRVLRGNEAAE